MYSLRHRPTSIGLRRPFQAGHDSADVTLLRSRQFLTWPSNASCREHTEEGNLVEAVTIPWFTIVSKLEQDPAFLNQLPWRKLEELVAGGYERAGYEVILTPRSSDGGRDIIAVKQDISIRIIDQIKAYAPGRRVTANDVRALLGVLSSDLNTSKGFVTTSAEFAPGIKDDPYQTIYSIPA